MMQLRLASGLWCALVGLATCGCGGRNVSVKTYKAPAGLHSGYVLPDSQDKYGHHPPTVEGDAVLLEAVDDARVSCVNVPCVSGPGRVTLESVPEGVEAATIRVEKEGFTPVEFSVPAQGDGWSFRYVVLRPEGGA